ncbi:MAG: hypothetical protein Ct9H300mP4_17810 [Gammaproteobacteria bacterium]|nr:MAG: hypothetical protein Ct9H300mP4_17810 [Gammaproteobacteria bacterium]
MVYGRHAIAFPRATTIRVKVEDCKKGVTLMFPSWGIEYQLEKDVEQRQSFEKPAGAILEQLNLTKKACVLKYFQTSKEAWDWEDQQR